MPVQLIVVLLVAISLILLTIQNPNPVQFQFMSWEAQQIPLIVVILISLAVGMIISSLWGFVKQFRLKEIVRRLQKELDETKGESTYSHDDPSDDLRY